MERNFPDAEQDIRATRQCTRGNAGRIVPRTIDLSSIPRTLFSPITPNGVACGIILLIEQKVNLNGQIVLLKGANYVKGHKLCIESLTARQR